LETDDDQPDHTQSSIASRPTLIVRQSLFAVFERWDVGALDVLANVWR
jgi:hypothetical protein